MRILVVGAGSTGGYFGGRLAQAGRDVSFLVHPGRVAQLREHGLQITSPHGDVTLHAACDLHVRALKRLRRRKRRQADQSESCRNRLKSLLR